MTFAGDFLTEETERQSSHNVIQIASVMLKFSRLLGDIIWIMSEHISSPNGCYCLYILQHVLVESC